MTSSFLFKRIKKFNTQLFFSYFAYYSQELRVINVLLLLLLCALARSAAACDASRGATRNARTSNVIYSRCPDLELFMTLKQHTHSASCCARNTSWFSRRDGSVVASQLIKRSVSHPAWIRRVTFTSRRRAPRRNFLRNFLTVAREKVLS